MTAVKTGSTLMSTIIVLALTSAGAPDSIAAPPLPPHSTVDQAADAITYRQIADDLEEKAEHYAKMAKRYRVRSSGGSKQQATLDNLAWRYERLAEEHRMAALRARKLAESKRSAVD